MPSHSRNWLIALGFWLIIGLVQPFYLRNLDAFMERHGLHQVLNTILDALPTWAAPILNTVGGFWAGVFTVMVLWGCVELFSVRQRKKRVQGVQSPSPGPGQSALVSGIDLRRAEDITSRWSIFFRAEKAMDTLTVCLDLQFYRKDAEEWGGVTRHVIFRRTSVVRGQTFVLPIIEDGLGPFEVRTPKWNVGESAPDGTGYVPGLPTGARCAVVFMAHDGQAQSFLILAFPRDLNEAVFLLGEDAFAKEDFWSSSRKGLDLRLTRGIRELPERSRPGA